MTASPLQGAWTKFYWARQHARRVDEAVERMFDTKGRPALALNIQIEQKTISATALARVKAMPKLRDEYGLTLGDAIQNFRAALDHAVWGIVTEVTTRPAKPQRVQFPMAKSARSFHNQIGERMPGVDPEIIKIVKRYQPYRRGDGPRAMRRLRDLSDRDKHRVLLPSLVAVADLRADVTCNWTLAGLDQLVSKGRRLDVGAPVLKAMLLKPRARAPECKVDVKCELAVYPSLGWGVAMTVTLNAIQSTVRDILSEIDTAL